MPRRDSRAESGPFDCSRGAHDVVTLGLSVLREIAQESRLPSKQVPSGMMERDVSLYDGAQHDAPPGHGCAIS